MEIWEALFNTEATHFDLERVRERTDRLKGRLVGLQTDLRSELHDLEEQVAGICLFNRTLLRLLTAKGIVSPKEFATQFDELDLEDRRLDGR